MSFVRYRGGGGLGNHWEVWGADPWVVEVLRFSYRLPFRVLPTLSQVPIPLHSYSLNSIWGIALTAVVADLRVKRAVEPAHSCPGFYSRIFVTPKSHRGLATGDRPLTPQPFGSGFQFPHGDCRFGSRVSSSGRLDGVPIFSGRIPSGSGASVIAPLPAVLRGVFGSPVLRVVLQPLICPAGFHAGHGPCLYHCTTTGSAFCGTWTTGSSSAPRFGRPCGRGTFSSGFARSSGSG